jgi:hypothetical protein
VLEVGTKGVSAQTRLERFKCRARVLAGGPVFEGALAVGRPSDGPATTQIPVQLGAASGWGLSDQSSHESVPHRKLNAALSLRQDRAGFLSREHRFLEGQS